MRGVKIALRLNNRRVIPAGEEMARTMIVLVVPMGVGRIEPVHNLADGARFSGFEVLEVERVMGDGVTDEFRFAAGVMEFVDGCDEKVDVVVHDDVVPEFEAEFGFCDAEEVDEFVPFFRGVEAEFSVVALADDVVEQAGELDSWFSHGDLLLFSCFNKHIKSANIQYRGDFSAKRFLCGILFWKRGLGYIVYW